jgi:DNA polymerase elongation subunit (family B)
MIEILKGAEDLAGCRRLLPALRDLVEEYRDRLRTGAVTAQELAITFQLSKDPAEYVHDTASTLAAKKLAAAGIKLHPGETVATTQWPLLNRHIEPAYELLKRHVVSNRVMGDQGVFPRL